MPMLVALWSSQEVPSSDLSTALSQPCLSPAWPAELCASCSGLACQRTLHSCPTSSLTLQTLPGLEAGDYQDTFCSSTTKANRAMRGMEQASPARAHSQYSLICAVKYFRSITP